MSERLERVEATGLTTTELAERLGTSDRALTQWVDETLSLEQSDIIELALAIYENETARAAAGWVSRFSRWEH